MRRVIVESPYGSKDPVIVARNATYARLCMHDCLVNHDEAPFASHLLYTQPGVLRDEIPNERELGINAGLAWGSVAEATVVYTDLGISGGMQTGIKRAKAEERPVEFRTIPEELVKRLK